MESGIEILDDSADSCSGTKSKQLTPEDSSAVKTEEGSADEANSKSASAEPKNWESDLLQSSDLKPLDGFSFPFVKTEYPIDPLPQSRSLLFKGLRYYAIGVTANIKKLLCDCSAVEESNLSELVTHVIAGKNINVYNPEATQAADLYDKTVVHEDWVETCHKYDALFPLDPYRLHRKRLFADMKICLSKLSMKDRRTLHFLIEHYGGKCTLKLDKSVTHLITGTSDGRKYEKAIKMPNMEVVAPDWVTDSIKAHQALSPKNFSPSRLVDSVESNYLHAIDSVLTGAFLGKTPTLDLHSVDIGSHIAGLVTKTSLGGAPTGRKKQLKDASGRFKSAGLGVKSPGLLTKKKLSKNTNKAGGFFVPGGSLLNLQKNTQSLPPGGPACVPLSPPSAVVIPSGSRFYGHDPEQHIPAECCLIACRFLIAEVDHLATPQEVEMWKKVIDNYCGIVSTGFNSKLTHILCTSNACKPFKKGIKESKRVVTPFWLNEVVKRKENFAPDEAIYFPVSFTPSRSVLQGKWISICGFTIEEREKIKLMLYTLGVKYSPGFNQNCFALICKDLNNEKVKKAQEWSIPVYNVEWLSDLLIRGKHAIENSSAAMYQNYEKDDPFKIDVLSYRELHKFMGAWLKPIKVNSGEIRKKSSYWEYLMLKQKQISDDPSSACIKKSRQTSAAASGEGGTQSREYVLFPPSRPLDQMPKVVFTGYDLESVEKLKTKLFSLGGRLATSMSECTHICAPAVLRTVKFLIGVCTVDTFVTHRWIEDSFECRWWQKETQYTPENEPLERTLGFRLVGSLDRAKQKKFLSGYRVYITPAVEPDFTTMQTVVEAGGGRMLRLEPESTNCHPNVKSIIISCEKDIPLCSKYKSKDVSVYSAELILAGALVQDLDFERFKLDLNARAAASKSRDEPREAVVTTASVQDNDVIMTEFNPVLPEKDQGQSENRNNSNQVEMPVVSKPSDSESLRPVENSEIIEKENSEKTTSVSIEQKIETIEETMEIDQPAADKQPDETETKTETTVLNETCSEKSNNAKMTETSETNVDIVCSSEIASESALKQQRESSTTESTIISTEKENLDTGVKCEAPKEDNVIPESNANSNPQVASETKVKMDSEEANLV